MSTNLEHLNTFRNQSCEEGNLSIVQFLHKYTPHIHYTEEIFIKSHISVKKWLVEKNIITLTDNLIYTLLLNLSIDLVNWLISLDKELKYKISKNIFEEAFLISCEQNYKCVIILYNYCNKILEFDFYKNNIFSVCCQRRNYIVVMFLLHIKKGDNKVSGNIITDDNILSVCLNKDLDFAKVLESYHKINKKVVLEKYKSCIGYDSMDSTETCDIINWLTA